MKASDIQELQRKLEKLQYERNQTEENSDSEDMVNIGIEGPPRAVDDSHMFRGREFSIEDFHVSTTLGTY
jgi:hypothetical protein